MHTSTTSTLSAPAELLCIAHNCLCVCVCVSKLRKFSFLSPNVIKVYNPPAAIQTKAVRGNPSSGTIRLPDMYLLFRN